MRTLLVLVVLAAPAIALADVAPPDASSGSESGGGGCSIGAHHMSGTAWLLAPLGLVLAGARRRRG